MYPEEMQESIKKLEETRAERMKQKLPKLTLEEKSKLLHKFHPDYKPKTTRKIKVGPNKGDKTPHEFADLLEAYSVIDPEKFDLSKVDREVDVLIIGGGGAGAAAALITQEQGASVLLATKLRLGDSNTTMAQGGIQAADKPEDSPGIHYIDTVGGGGFKNVPELVHALVMEAPGAIKWLEDSGVMFDKAEDGTMVTISGGGASRNRLHCCWDYTGGEIMKTLKDEVLNRGIEIAEFSPAVELLTENGRCTGAILYNLETGEYLVVKAKATILATGGSGRLHVQGFPTTNHYGATGDGLVLAYRAGCRLTFMDTIQYHPTGVAFPEQIVGLLVTEKVRSMGGHLVNREGKRFVNELDTRDTVASAEIRECVERKKGVPTPSGTVGVWLDFPLVEIINGEGTIRRSFPAMYRQFNRFGIDITKQPALVYPTQHYQNGGMVINERCETSVDCLYAAGEVTGGLHGRNRLMGNSLLDLMVFGRRAGMAAAEKVKNVQAGKLSLEHVRRYHGELKRSKVKRERVAPIVLPDYRGGKWKRGSSIFS